MSKTIFITGASSGFGASSARLFAKHGWQLVLAARRSERLDALREELEDITPVYTVTLNVQDRDAVETAFKELPQHFQVIDVLLNSAGLALGRDAAYLSNLDDWDTMVDTNIKGLMYCSHCVLPSMVKRRRGHIINISSVAANYAYPGGHVYGASKAFVKHFSSNLRSDLLGTNVKVTSLEPGLTETEFSLVRFNNDQEKSDAIYKGTEPMKAEDIADIIFWLASQPEHISINSLEVMPTCQAVGPMAIHREK